MITAHMLSPDTVAEIVDTLRYLDREFIRHGEIDAINMRHVEAALALVDADQRATTWRAIPITITQNNQERTK